MKVDTKKAIAYQIRMSEELKKYRTYEEEQKHIVRHLMQRIGKNVKNKGYSADLLEALRMEMMHRRRMKAQTLGLIERILAQTRDDTLSLQEQIKSLCSSSKSIKESMGKSKKRQAINPPEDDGSRSALDMYDRIIDINLLADLADNGWKVEYAERSKAQRQEERTDWAGAVVAVVGLYDKGKTFVLNHLTGANLPSGKKVRTKGLSFKHMDVDGTQFVLLDSAGSNSPVRVENELSVYQKEATEHFILDIIFEVSDYFICVCNDFTSLDQRYLGKLARSLQRSKKHFQEIIVIHNFKDVTSVEVLEHLWKTQVTQLYSGGGGATIRTSVAALDSRTEQLDDRTVVWFKTRT
uniref:G domain-containing protein n=1 Tax=Lotharella oceanica TaxID=641309 RepID=A0A7S2U4D3_9EUKA